MNTLICSACFCSPIPAWAAMKCADIVYIDQHEHYQKRSYRNKYSILSPNGVQTLSIPLLKGKNEQMPVQEVRIAYNESWIAKHLQAIRSSYGKSPYFEYYFDEWAAILQKRWTYLFDLNMEMMDLMIKLMGWSLNMQLTERFYNSGEFTLDLREKLWPHIMLETNLPSPYLQVWQYRHGHIANLSILDLLFCAGPEADIILTQLSRDLN